jgi:hypothetical protein
MRAVTERRELSSIAYGFMASKALFAALGVDLFTYLACRGDGVSFSADALGRLRDHGFVPSPSEVLIPETTRTILCRKTIMSKKAAT